MTTKNNSNGVTNFPQDWNFIKKDADLNDFCEKLTKHIWRTEIIIEGIHCLSCIFSIENKLKQFKGIKKVNIHLTSNHAIIEWNNHDISIGKWVRAIESLGFKVFLSESKNQLTNQNNESKKILWNWMVALICTFQIMMFSMPSYYKTCLTGVH
jgi:Cu2+-exporting ATPase